ncbi:sugar ABC transporter ATP-binding protein [Cellulomonas dongxiuzhuiae]|uniref:sugar ABC transporter ATP-binding protein n=1 Tax=Cellulomonas dongxiuzhuiae TaxID=2819979 RepID=UPI001AAEE50C|nr:sugar ABC transporter ATP-binding protein [Cellulomonas dongxiuzhuiae]MBO3089815.1 sugar ABC transporter ATP-binding protein [Cellulomonas dongxiuzhuiae]
MTETTPVLVMRGIRKSFAGNEVLHGVDLEVRPGEIHALVGHNGAGKSTLIKVLGGVYADYSGDIVLGGAPTRFAQPQDSLAAGVAVIHQEFSLVPEFDAAQNLALGHEPRRRVGLVDHRATQAQGKALLERLGLTVPLGVPSRDLSVAHQQLTEIAKSLSRDARILVMDEPTSRLARAEREALFAIMRSVSARGVGIIYISHFLDEVLAVADRVTVLRDGTAVTTCPAGELTVDRLAEHIVGQSIADRAPNAAGDDAAPVVLELEQFGQRGRRGATLQVRAGQVLGLAGLVGSGRSSFLESLCAARPAQGSMRLGGAPVRFGSPADAAARGVVLVPEDRKHKGVIMQRGVDENIVLTALSRKYARKGVVRGGLRRRAVRASIQRFGIRTPSPESPIAALSGGNQQKTLIARASEADPVVLLLDQPTAGVDIGAKGEIYAQVRALAAQGVACVVASDELEELLVLCDDIAVVRSGQIGPAQRVADLDEPTLLAQISSKGDHA